MFGLPPMMDGLGAGEYMKNKAYDQSEAGKKEYKDELTKINEANKRLYENIKYLMKEMFQVIKFHQV